MYKMAIIDGSQLAINSLKQTLQDHPLFETISEAPDGTSGLGLLRRERPHLALVEINLQGISGLELLQAAAEENLPTLIIVTSNNAEFAYAQKAIFYNAVGYCLKPYSKTELYEYLEKAASILSNNGTNNYSLRSYHTGNEMVDKMLDYIHQNYTKDLSVQELADLCHINYNYAGQLFRHETGETINNFLMRIRMDKASELLRNTALSIADVAAETGYRDYFYFAKIFKKHWGTTPSIFRSSNTPSSGGEI